MTPQPKQQQHRTRPTAPAPSTRPLQPDDKICGSCGEGNEPTRRFCSRCGNSLDTAVVVPTPWWRKILRRFRERRIHEGGARPKRRLRLLTYYGAMSMVRRVLIVAALLAALLYAVAPSMRQGVNEFVLGIKDRIVTSVSPNLVQATVSGTRASAEIPDHPAALATDRVIETYWAAPHAAQPVLVVQFERPTDLAEAIVHNGADKDFAGFARPRDLAVTYFSGDRLTGTSSAQLEDVPEEKRIKLDGKGVTRVEIRVLNVHGAAASPDLALSFIQFFQPE